VECLFDHGRAGGFTTFSTFSLDTVLLCEQGAWQTAVGYIALSVVSCLVGAGLGVGVGQGASVNMRALSHTSTMPFRGKLAAL
jgi:fluoride ion exporter CrcB/FEX